MSPSCNYTITRCTKICPIGYQKVADVTVFVSEKIIFANCSEFEKQMQLSQKVVNVGIENFYVCQPKIKRNLKMQ